MLHTTKITAAMFPELYEALLRAWNPNLSLEQWRRAFVQQWPIDEDYFGYALTDGGRIVGMLGMLFSQRMLRGQTRRFCNLHCWHVKPDYRANSLALLKPILDLKHHIITDFTPSAAVCAIARRIGFKPLDSTVLVLPPLLSDGKLGAVAVRELRASAEREIAGMPPVHRRIFEDHQNIECGHMIAHADSQSCYVAYSRIAPNRLPYCLVHYASNPAFFAEHHAAIRSHLINRGQSHFVAVDARMFDRIRVPFAFRANARETLYRGHDVASREIDTLYSEVAIFKHSPLPTLQQRLRATVKQCIPPAVRRFVGISSSP